ncbi:MAG: acetate kinase, partial [Clostridia bacterium]|nr:acetate kinase [Clostridia bacterium]
NDKAVRVDALADLDYLGIKVDAEKNANARNLPAPCDISADDSKVRVFVIPTNEELVIARDTKAVLEA